MNQSEKKKRLERYHESMKRVAGIDKQIEELRLMEIPGAIRITDMPKGKSQTDLSDYAARFDELDQQRMKERTKMMQHKVDLILAINKVADDQERKVLALFYLSDDPNPDVGDICKQMGYERSKVFELRKAAINSIFAD